MELFDRKAFTTQFQSIASTRGNSTLNYQQLGQLFNKFDMAMYPESIRKMCARFFFYKYRQDLQFNKKKNKPTEAQPTHSDSNIGTIHQINNHSAQYGQHQQQRLPSQQRRRRIEERQAEGDNQQNQVKKTPQQWQEEASNHELDLNQALLFAELNRKKLKSELFKKTCDALKFQFAINAMSQNNSYPKNDPGQEVSLTVLVGDPQPQYNSSIKIKISKFPQQNQTNPSLRVRLVTRNLQESNQLKTLVENIYSMASEMISNGEFSDGESFLKSIKLESDARDNYFEVRVASENASLNELIRTILNTPDSVFKTEFKLLLAVLVEFNFDLSSLLNGQSTIYDILTKNIRVKAQLRTTEYLTALKDIMVVQRMFDNLADYTQDSDSLMLILLVNIYKLNLEIKFKNPQFGKEEKQTTMAALGLFYQFQEMIAQMEEESADMANIIKNSLKHDIEFEASLYDMSISATLSIQNIDKLMEADLRVVMEELQNNMQNEMEGQQNEMEGQQGSQRESNYD